MWQILFGLVFLFYAGCSSVNSDAGGGTFVSNPPTQPTQNSLDPDFDSKFFETTLDSAADSDVSTLVTDDASWLASSAESDPAFALSEETPAGAWTAIFLEGPVRRARVLRKRFSAWAERIAERVSESEEEFTSTPRVFFLEDLRLLDQTRDWNVAISVPEDNLIKVVISDSSDGAIWAYYLIAVDSVGDPESGLFAYVNPLTFDNNPESGVRFFAMAFDFNDSSENRLSLTLDDFDADEDLSVVWHIKYQCDESTKDCVGEFVGITGVPPDRTFHSRSVRYSWNDDTNSICLALVNYPDGVATLGTTQSFTGPLQPDEVDVIEGVCTIATPYWADETFTPDDLPLREDDDQDGGFAAALFGNGESDDTWEELLSIDLVADWLLGRF